MILRRNVSRRCRSPVPADPRGIYAAGRSTGKLPWEHKCEAHCSKNRSSVGKALMTIVHEVLVILLLVLLNSVFSMAELAIVSSRKARLKVLADEGNRGAASAFDLAENPGRFLSTVQIGITLVTTPASASSLSCTKSPRLPTYETNGWNRRVPPCALPHLPQAVHRRTPLASSMDCGSGYRRGRAGDRSRGC